MAEHEEVIIDGDSPEEKDEDEVTIITPESRKRRFRSNILLDQDEDEEDEETKMESVKDTAFSPILSPRRPQHLLLGKNGVLQQPIKPRILTLNRQARRNLHQLSMLTAVARGERGRQQEEGEEKKVQDVRTFLPLSAISVGRSECMRQRKAVEKNDEKIGKQHNGQQDLDDQEVEIVTKETSASRQSYRIDKDKPYNSYRKLNPNLDNNVESLQSLGLQYNGLDDQDEDAYESDKHILPIKRRRHSVPRVGERDFREKEYVEAGDDVDDFICGDDEVEYMNDDEEAVISVESSDAELEEDHPDVLMAMLAAGRSREIHEWFAIYMEYLEECVIDGNFETTMRRKRSKAKHQLYEQAIHCIERKLCSCRDTVRSGVAWPDEMVDALKHASLFRSSQVSADHDCDACNRRQHIATYHVELAGYACDATKLYSLNWIRHLKEAVKEANPVQISFEMGSVCHAVCFTLLSLRTLAYWQILHAKQFWCILIDAKRKSCADITGRIADPYRDDFFKKEFGRYKNLVGLVEKFADDSKHITQFMPNAWKRITNHNVTSDFLPLASRVTSVKSRRGTLDAFIDKSEGEEAEDEEEVMEQMKKEKHTATCRGTQATNDGEEAKDTKMISPLPLPRSERQMPRSESKKESKFHLTTETQQKEDEPQLRDENTVSERDIDDLVCLVCNANPRNAGVVHGLYLHVYCCFACAKRQHRQKNGCMVCNRPIDRVFRLLPLTLDARKAIRNQQTRT